MDDRCFLFFERGAFNRDEFFILCKKTMSREKFFFLLLKILKFYFLFLNYNRDCCATPDPSWRVTFFFFFLYKDVAFERNFSLFLGILRFYFSLNYNWNRYTESCSFDKFLSLNKDNGFSDTWAKERNLSFYIYDDCLFYHEQWFVIISQCRIFQYLIEIEFFFFSYSSNSILEKIKWRIELWIIPHWLLLIETSHSENLFILFAYHRDDVNICMDRYSEIIRKVLPWTVALLYYRDERSIPSITIWEGCQYLYRH